MGLVQNATGYHLGPVAPPRTDGASFLEKRDRRDSNSGLMGEKRKRYLCAMPPHPTKQSIDKKAFKVQYNVKMIKKSALTVS